MMVFILDKKRVSFTIKQNMVRWGKTKLIIHFPLASEVRKMKEKEKVKVIGKLLHFNEVGFWYLFFHSMSNFIQYVQSYGLRYDARLTKVRVRKIKSRGAALFNIT